MLPAYWAPFVSAFEARFGFAPLWVDLDEVSAGRSRVRPRLTVVLERTAQYERFVPALLTTNHSAERSVRRLLERTGSSLHLSGGLPRRRARPVGFEGLFVVFCDFERLATEHAHAMVTREEARAFEESLLLGDRLWCTARLWGPPVVFVWTDADAARVRSGGETERFAELWYAVAKAHDEFGYLTREAVAVPVDSKENFDATYSSNWYYYFK